jgi:hypothetical protein
MTGAECSKGKARGRGVKALFNELADGPDEGRVSAGSSRAHESHAQGGCQVFCLAIEVVDNFQVIGDEAHWRNDHVADALSVQRA